MELKTILEQIGLTEGESKVYLALLSLGSTTSGPIVKKSGISASKAYEILDKLAKKGLVSHIMRAKTKYFRAADPSRIVDYLDEKEKLIHNQKSQIKKILPVLKQKVIGKPEEAEVFEGQKGIMTARERVLDVLKKGDTLQVIGSSKKSQQSMDAYWKDFHARRTKAGIKAEYIVEEDLKDDIEIKKLKGKLIKAKYLPSMGPIHIDLYGDYTVLNLVQDAKLAFSIKNKQVTDSFRNYFDLMWSQEVQIYKNRKGVEIGDNDNINEGKEIITFGMGRKMTLKYYPNLVKKWIDNRMKHKIKVRHLVTAPATEEERRICYDIPYTEVRYLPEKYFTPVTTLVYGDKVSIWIWTEPEFTLMLIKNKKLADNYRKNFELMWKHAKKSTP
jgi:sugar-specific transcriptional regulator TrmB